MKRLLYFTLLFGLIACRNMNYKNQSEGIVIMDSDFDFGVIPDSIHILTHRFKIDNNTNDTCRILRIEKSCGCTRVKESTSVIAPHSSAYLDVEVDLGANYNFFERDINVYTNRLEEPITIFVRASRKMPKQVLSKEFPVKISDNLRINIPYVIMGNISFGHTKSSSINIINTSPDNIPISARLIDAPSYVDVYCDDELKPNEYGRIVISIDLTEIKDIWGLQKYTLRLESNKDKLDVPIEAIFIDNLPTRKDKPRLHIPIANYTVNTYKDSVVWFPIENIGKDILHIRNVKADSYTKQIQIGASELQPNKRDTIIVSLRRGQKNTVVVGISSDDPIEPYKEIRVFCMP